MPQNCVGWRSRASRITPYQGGTRYRHTLQREGERGIPERHAIGSVMTYAVLTASFAARSVVYKANRCLFNMWKYKIKPQYLRIALFRSFRALTEKIDVQVQNSVGKFPLPCIHKWLDCVADACEMAT
jgi:hypothetical protein